MKSILQGILSLRPLAPAGVLMLTGIVLLILPRTWSASVGAGLTASAFFLGLLALAYDASSGGSANVDLASGMNGWVAGGFAMAHGLLQIACLQRSGRTDGGVFAGLLFAAGGSMLIAMATSGGVLLLGLFFGCLGAAVVRLPVDQWEMPANLKQSFRSLYLGCAVWTLTAVGVCIVVQGTGSASIKAIRGAVTFPGDSLTLIGALLTVVGLGVGFGWPPMHGWRGTGEERFVGQGAVSDQLLMNTCAWGLAVVASAPGPQLRPVFLAMGLATLAASFWRLHRSASPRHSLTGGLLLTAATTTLMLASPDSVVGNMPDDRLIWSVLVCWFVGSWSATGAAAAIDLCDNAPGTGQRSQTSSIRPTGWTRFGLAASLVGLAGGPPTATFAIFCWTAASACREGAPYQWVLAIGLTTAFFGGSGLILARIWRPMLAFERTVMMDEEDRGLSVAATIGGLGAILSGIAPICYYIVMQRIRFE